MLGKIYHSTTPLHSSCIFRSRNFTPFFAPKSAIIFFEKFLQKHLEYSKILSIFALENQATSYMDIIQFTKIFLPNLASEYAKGTLPLHALVDVDLWKKVFPDGKGTRRSDKVHWQQVEFTCCQLLDHSLLFTFILPQPKRQGEPRFAAFRIMLASQSPRTIVYYLLTKPQSDDDPWDILYLPLPLGADKMELKFKQKISGQENLRNFVHDVQQIDFNDDSYAKSLFDDLRSIFGNMFRTQDDSRR